MGLNNRHLIPYGVPNPPVGSREQGEETRIKIGLGNGTVFLNVGMLESWKGTDLLVKAFKDVHDPEARLVIVGKGRLEPIIRSAARDDSRICYLGAQTQDSLGAIYASADVFVLPSRREAWGLVIDEAICNGLRVIASDAIGSASERVTQENGWIFPSEDTNALARIFNDAIKLKRDGWAQLPMKSGYNAAAAMIEDLQHMGVEFKITQESNHAT